MFLLSETMVMQEAEKTGRVAEIDFVKCVLIVLMIAFHLVFIGDSYPYAKQVVYTFHMPGFLVISGYLLNVGKPWRKFLRTMLWIFVPYAVMESGYTAMAAVLPIREHIDSLTFSLYINKVLLHPLGPYWYLHTLLLCSTVYYGVAHCGHIGPLGRFVAVALLYGLLWYIGIVSLPCALYFLGGAAVRLRGVRFTRFFRPSLWALLPMAILAFFPVNMDKGSIGGVLFVYLSVCFILGIYRVLQQWGARLLPTMLFVGRNTLLLLLFSPVFTALAKLWQPMLVGIDRSGMVFLVVSVTVAVAGSIAIGWVLDKLHLSRFIFGKRRVVG